MVHPSSPVAREEWPPARGVCPSADATCRTPTDSAGPQAAAPGRRDVLPAGNPTVFVAVGGVATEVLAGYVMRLRSRAGIDVTRSAVRLLLLDTDGKALTTGFGAGDQNIRLLPIRLLSAEAYRSRSSEILNWMSRRWFYNIPCDHTTNGYRPFGRLALVTHSKAVREAVSASLAEAVEDSRASPGPCVPRVFVVGSISGGTAGGALIDLAYLVRTELKKRGLPDDDVHGVLLYSTPRGKAERDKSLVNAVATLHELVHFGRPGNHFPGEVSLGVPPYPANDVTFGRTHFLRLGDGLSRCEWELATDSAAEFLYCSTMTPAWRVLEDRPAARDRPEDRAGGCQTVRSYDVVSLGAGMGPRVSRFVRRVSLDVARLWLDGRDHPRQAGAVANPTAVVNAYVPGMHPSAAVREADVRQKLAECNLTTEQLHQEAIDILTLEVGCDAEEYARLLIDVALPIGPAGEQTVTDGNYLALAMIDRLLKCPPDIPETAPIGASLCDRVAARLAIPIGARAESLLDSIRNMIDSPGIRVEGARQFAVSAIRMMRESRQWLTAQALRLRSTPVTFDVEAPPGKIDDPSRLLEWAMRQENPEDRRRQILTSYAGYRIQESLCHAVAGQIRSVETGIGALVKQLGDLLRRLRRLANQFEEAPQENFACAAEPVAAAGPRARYQQIVLEQLNLSRHEIARTVEKAIDDRVLEGDRGLRRFLEPGCEPQTLLSSPLVEASRSAVLSWLAGIVGRFAERPPVRSAENGTNDLVDILLEAHAGGRTTAADGAVDRILIVPKDVDCVLVRKRIKRAFPNVIVIGAPTCDITLCTVHGEHSLEQVAREIIGGIDAFEELAERLHTRIDVHWTPLSGPEPADRRLENDRAETRPLTNTAVMPVPKA